MPSLKKGLAALVSENGKDSNLFLPAVAFAYNSTNHNVTGVLPFFLPITWEESCIACAKTFVQT